MRAQHRPRKSPPTPPPPVSPKHGRARKGSAPGRKQRQAGAGGGQVGQLVSRGALLPPGPSTWALKLYLPLSLAHRHSLLGVSGRWEGGGGKDHLFPGRKQFSSCSLRGVLTVGSVLWVRGGHRILFLDRDCPPSPVEFSKISLLRGSFR